MALPLLLLLPATASAAYNIIVAGARQGLSTRAIERLVRRADLPISRSRSIVPLRRAVIAAERAGAAVRFIPKNLVINVLKLPESLVAMKGPFQYTVRLSGIDSLGNAILRRITVRTTRRTITPGEIEELARQLVTVEGESNTLVEVEATLEFGRRNPEVPG